MKTIATGQMTHADGHKVTYEILNGWDPDLCAHCDDSWGAYTVEFFDFIARQGFTGDRIAEVIDSMQLEDSRWSWSRKASKLTAEGFEWFYLMAERKPQGVCVIYHPKESKLTPGNIFYVDFLAVAPWNRDCAIRKRQLKGIGTALLRAALKYSVEQLKLSAGFCLHSLPQAVVYYKKLKMVPIEEHDKGPLSYFELPADVATQLMGVA